MKKIRLPEMIDYFRKENGWTMKEFGEKLDKSESAISKWIKGVRSPMVEDFDKMVNLFNTDPDTLMYGASELSTTLSEINKISSQLEEPRQKIVLEAAKTQLKEQEPEKETASNIIALKTRASELTDEEFEKALDEAVKQTVAFDGKPLDEREQAIAKQMLRDAWEEDNGKR